MHIGVYHSYLYICLSVFVCVCMCMCVRQQMDKYVNVQKGLSQRELLQSQTQQTLEPPVLTVVLWRTYVF